MIVLAVLLAAALLPGVLTRRGGRHFRPRVWARLVLASLVGTAIYVWLALLLLSAPVLLGAVAGSSLEGICSRALYGLEPAGPALAWSATALVVVTAPIVALGLYRSHRRRAPLRVPPEIGTHVDRGDFDLVILPVTTPLAYSLGGRHPQVVVSEGLRARLEAGELAAVLAHEAVHVGSRHDRWLRWATVTTATLWFAPWVRRAADALRVALERWADEEAALVVGRDTLRRALLSAADVGPLGPAIAGLNGADALCERVVMLEVAPRHSSVSFALFAAGVSVVLTAAALATAAGGMSELLVLFGRLCPI